MLIIHQNDFLSWLMDEAKGEERSPEHLTNRILHINFASIHTSSMVCSLCCSYLRTQKILQSFTHALYELASQPRYLQPLREEVEAIIETEGWTKSSVSKMRKLDSFLKESQRYNGISLGEHSDSYGFMFLNVLQYRFKGKL